MVARGARDRRTTSSSAVGLVGRVAAGMLVAGALLAACSGDGDGPSASPADRSTTSVDVTIDQRTPAPSAPTDPEATADPHGDTDTDTEAGSGEELVLASEPIELGPLEPRGGHSVIWTGTEVLVWGGEGDEMGRTLFADGAAYEPNTASWRSIATSPLTPRSQHLATWTGEAMLVVGGIGERDGAAYDPSTDSWRPIEPPPIPVSGNRATGVDGVIGSAWTGSDLVVWHVPTDRVATYDPAADAWTELPSTGLESDRGALRWDGTAIYALGATVADYPATNELSLSRLTDDGWEPLPPTDFSTEEYVIGADPRLTAWTGDRLLAWSDSGDEGRTMAFDPGTGAWSEAPPVPVTGCEGFGEPVAGDGLVVAFGWCGSDAAFFETSTRSWRITALGGYPTARYTVWTGEELINWGDTCCYGTGGRPFTAEAWRYRPAS